MKINVQELGTQCSECKQQIKEDDLRIKYTDSGTPIPVCGSCFDTAELLWLEQIMYME